MRALSAGNQTALQDRQLVARDFLWVVARDRTTGNAVSDGLWSDVGNINAQVINVDTGLAEARDWFGSGTLIEIGDIPLVHNLSVQTVEIRVSHLHARIQDLVRTYDCRQARVEIYRGLFNPTTRQMVAPAEARFVGFIDTVEINEPSENDEGSCIFTCTTHTQELTRANADTRSHASQQLRNAVDTFYKDVAVVGGWELFWGKKAGKLPSQSVNDGRPNSTGAIRGTKTGRF